VGLLPECETRQDNTGERYKLDDQPARLIASEGRVEIDPERRGGDQVDDANGIAQIFITHDFLLNVFLPLQPNVAVRCVGIVKKSVRNYALLIQEVVRKPYLSTFRVTFLGHL
jgi:hypothetical protein